MIAVERFMGSTMAAAQPFIYTGNTGIRFQRRMGCPAIPWSSRNHKRRDSSPTTFTSSGGETGDEYQAGGRRGSQSMHADIPSTPP